MVLASNEIVFIFFYAEWCWFSNMFMPIFDDAADAITKAGYDTGRVVMGKVDFVQQSGILTRFHITEYPTLKLFRNGLLTRKEYMSTGEWSVEAVLEFIKEQLTDPVISFSSLKELTELSEDKKHIIAYMDRRDQPEYENLRKVAADLKDKCIFHAGFGDASAQMHPPGQPIVVFRTDRKTSTEPDETYKGSLLSFNELYSWVQEKCIPLVREITYENSKELTEEGFPFLSLFHHPSDTESIKKYKEIISRELEPEKQYMNFVTVDGVRFEHLLHHYRKSISDLPLIIVNSYPRFNLFPDYKDMEKPGALKQFLQDYFSGKLHR